MPKVYLTAEQWQQARYDAKAQQLAEALAMFKFHQHLHNKDIARTLGIRDTTVARLLDGDRTEAGGHCKVEGGDGMRGWINWRRALECAAFVVCFAASLGASAWVEVLL